MFTCDSLAGDHAGSRRRIRPDARFRRCSHTWRTPMTNDTRRSVLMWFVSMLMAVAVIAASAHKAHAVVGGILTTADIPAGAQCNGSSGTALAVLSGGKIGKTQFPILVAT